MIRAILVDDENMANTVLSEMLKKHQNVEIVGSYTDPLIALKEIEDTNPDVIFLDIEMGDVNGIEMGESFTNEKPDVYIIFVTAYSDYAIEAFELNAIDYLLKPVLPSRLEKAISRISLKEKKPKDETQSNKMYIQSFGHFSIFNSNKEPKKWRTNKSKELFALLWTHEDEVLDRDYLIEMLFPERDASKANTLFSTTLYQTRKNLSDCLGDACIQQINRGYKFNIEIESDYKTLKTLIASSEYKEDDIDKIKALYKHDFLEFEDYPWKNEISQNIRNNIKIHLFNLLGTLTNTQEHKLLTEEILLFLYQLDRTDDQTVKYIVDFYQSSNQPAKLTVFYQEHIAYLENELDIEIPEYLE